MEQQLQKNAGEIAGVKQMKEKVDALLGSLGEKVAELEPTKPDRSSKKLVEGESLSRERQNDAWRALEAMDV